VWEFALLVGVKAFQGIGNYLEVRENGPYWIEAVTAHEDVIFFDVAIVLALVMFVLRVRGRLFFALIALQPVILAAELLTTRRVAFVALAAALFVLVLMSAVERPKKTFVVVGLVVVVFAIYAATFWEVQSHLAEPVRALRLIVDPSSLSARDRGSDLWREIENANIAFTVRQLPITGVGLGQEYLFQQEPPPLTNFVFWRYFAHNALLWMWLKAGPYGAFALWFLVAQVITVALGLYRRLDAPFLRVAASLPVLMTVAQVVFSSVDLGLTYGRTGTVLGVALGLTAPLSAWATFERTLDSPSGQSVSYARGLHRPSLSGAPARVEGSVP